MASQRMSEHIDLTLNGRGALVLGGAASRRFARAALLASVLGPIGATQAWAQLQFPLPTPTHLYTPPLAANFLTCSVVNTSSINQLVSAKIYNNFGYEIASSPIYSFGCTTLEPGKACGVWVPNNSYSLAYCRISVSPGTKQDVRGSLYGSSSSSDGVRAVVVSAQ